jgi:hypothetical protein
LAGEGRAYCKLDVCHCVRRTLFFRLGRVEGGLDAFGGEALVEDAPDGGGATVEFVVDALEEAVGKGATFT